MLINNIRIIQYKMSMIPITYPVYKALKRSVRY